MIVRHFHRLPAQQRGVALITAMLLMVIGVLVAAQIAWDNQLHVRRATMAADMDQAKLFALGAEAIAIAAIRADSDDADNLNMTSIPTHALGEGLLVAQELPVGVEDQNFGVMIGKLDDLQGRFNLNNLLESDGVTPDPDALLILQRLLEELRLDVNLADAIVDWMDSDTVPLQRGAEDGIYTSLDPPYRPPNRNFTHVSELRAVAGIGDAEYRELRRHLIALPVNGCKVGSSPGSGDLTTLNLNFATPEVLVSLSPAVTESIAQGWIDAAETQGLADVSELGSIATDQDFTRLVQGNYVGFATHCFGLTVYVTIGNSVLSMYSVLERGGIAGKDVFVRQRIFGIENPD